VALTIDRMEIDDAGGNPAKLAASILKQLPDLSARIPVREIAAAVDIYDIREERLEGLEGALVVADDKSEGAILVRSDRPERRKRYTIAHELGHYVNPWHQSDSPEGFRCRASDMAVDDRSVQTRALKMEYQANEFAAELLMPANELRAFLRRKSGVDVGHILKLADRFFVSREAMARRYVTHVDEPAAIIFSRENQIRYIKKTEDFPRLDVWNRDPLPANSLSCVSNTEIGEVTDWTEVSGQIWLDRSQGYTLYEQTLAQQNGFRITLLTVDKTDEENDAWEMPQFRR